MHLALASHPEIREFAQEPYALVYQTSLYQSLRVQAIRSLELLESRLAYLPEGFQADARALLGRQKDIITFYDRVRRGKIKSARIRCHGDYHLGQVLFTGKDFVIIDFEGEPARALSERRIKRSPLRDVAGMLRSFDYAAKTALDKQLALIPTPENTLPLLNQWAQHWYTWVAVNFLSAYLDTMKSSGLLPDDPGQLRTLLDAFLYDKALYEISYELNNRPDWVKVPIQGILQMLAVEA